MTVQRPIVWFFVCLHALFQIICTAVVVALSILLGGGSLVCLSRGSWTRGDQVQDESSTADLVVEEEPDGEAQREPQLSNGGTGFFADRLRLVTLSYISMETSKTGYSADI